MSDVRFYDFEFNLVHILPPSSNSTGYSSMNVTQEFNGSGSLELVFQDDDLKKKIEDYNCNLFVVWGEFQGFLTSYIWQDNSCRVTGMHLNGLLHRAVIPSLFNIVTVKDDKENERQEKQAVADSFNNLLKSTIDSIEWLNYEPKTGFTDNVSYLVEKYTTADTYIQGLLDLIKGGYAITADFKLKRLIIEPFKRSENRIMLSEDNLNAYNFETSYINKELAYGAWFEKEVKDKDGKTLDPIWTYISLNDKKGIYKVDTVLTAKTEAEAEAELKKRIAEFKITAETRNINYGVDYKLGDIVRVQHDGKTVKRLVSGVNLWQEQEYGEQPILTELEE